MMDDPYDVYSQHEKLEEIKVEITKLIEENVTLKHLRDILFEENAKYKNANKLLWETVNRQILELLDYYSKGDAKCHSNAHIVKKD